MDRKTLALFVSTLIVGMFTGAYFYVTVFAPEYKDNDLATSPTDQNALIIEGQMHGGCMQTNTCASFKLVDDGSYDYLAYPGTTVRQGFIAGTSTDIFSSIGTLEFFDDAKPIPINACTTHMDTTEFTYTVTLGGKSYVLDTCTTAFASDKPMQSLFLKIWPTLEDPTAAYPAIVKDGIFGYFFDLFEHPQREK